MAAVLVTAAACSLPQGQSPAAAPVIQTIETVPGAGVSTLAVVGLPEGDLAAVRTADLSDTGWHALLRVTATADEAAGDVPPVTGRYRVEGGTLRFEPAFPLDPLVAHRAVFDPVRLPPAPGRGGEAWRAEPITLAIGGTTAPVVPVTRVVQMFPPEVLLENQLRMYLQFSSPMGGRPARDYVRVLDEAGREVVDAFLPLDVSLWNADRTRCTLLFDPGRVKRGILPNAELGRPLTAGRRYTLVVSREWRDAEDQPLVEEFRRAFRVVPAALTAIEPTDWRLLPPAAGGREPLAVIFPRALDHALAERALVVRGPDGRQMEGAVAVDDAATRWRFTPATAWQPGTHQLRALSVLEDAAGNRVGRAFDADPRREGSVVDGGDIRTEAVIPFDVGALGGR
ncbi:MAG: hypothetical protein Q7J25_00835 [Vicinamibacterales bacterium]|nr:hypothetical protein [Vicinamibacterales bacterium]